MDRSEFLAVLAGLVINPMQAITVLGEERPVPTETLISVPLELGGDWGESPQAAAYAVLSRMRDVCLSGITFFSDQQPEKLFVDNHRTGPPCIWLHTEPRNTAWIIVDIGTRDWCKLAYQFGHELGHVLCNSWYWGDDPRPPSQWLEEAIVEAFSIRGLTLLAESWERDPPFADDSAFSGAIRKYLANLLTGYRKAAKVDLADWLGAGQPMPEHSAVAPKGPAVVPILAKLKRDKRCVEDMGALNRWPERTGLPIAEYLQYWQKSSREIDAPGLLPKRVGALLKLT
jgi:hypothetical protein